MKGNIQPLGFFVAFHPQFREQTNQLQQHPGHHADAPTTMILPADLAKRIFIEGDQSAGMQGFMSGQIRIEGDMSKLMALQTAQPSADQVALMKQIQEVTA